MQVKKKLSIENFANIILTSHPEHDAVYTMLSQASIPDIDYVELIMKSTTSSDLVAVSNDYYVANRNGYQWSQYGVIVYNNGNADTLEPEPEPEPMPESQYQSLNQCQSLTRDISTIC